MAHYWIVDIERQRIECLRLPPGERDYAAAAEASGDDTLAHPDWPGLVITPAALWR